MKVVDNVAEIMLVIEEMKDEMGKAIGGSKRAAVRARRATTRLQVLLKKFRKITIDIGKK